MTRPSVATLTLGLLLAAGLAFGLMSGGRSGTAPVAVSAAMPQPALPSDDLRSAERNLYPGPDTVLQMAAALGLDPQQRQEMHALQQRVDAELAALSRRIAREERRLDFAFAQGDVTPGRIDSLTAQIGSLQGKLRATRLRGHIAARDLLTAGQLLRFAELRGFQPAPQDLFDDLDRDDAR